MTRLENRPPSDKQANVWGPDPDFFVREALGFTPDAHQALVPRVTPAGPCSIACAATALTRSRSSYPRARASSASRAGRRQRRPLYLRHPMAIGNGRMWLT